MRKRNVQTRRWRAVALLATGALVGTLLAASPAGAHFQASLSHITKHMKRVFYTKGQADSRFAKGGSMRIVPIAYDAPKGSSALTRVLNAEGLSLDVRCDDQLGSPNVRVQWRTSTDNARVSRWFRGADALEDYDSDTDLDAGEGFVGDNGLPGAVQGTTAYVNAQGGQVTVHWSTLGTNADDRCRLMGYAVIDPAG